MNYTVTLCNEDSGTGDTLEVEATGDRQAVLVAIHQMDWRNHARVTVYPDGEVQGWAEDESGRFYFSGRVILGPQHGILR